MDEDKRTSSKMRPRDNDQYFIHADGGEPANPSLPAHLTLDLDTPSEDNSTSRDPSVPESGDHIHQPSTALITPDRILTPWSAGSSCAMAVGHNANDLAAVATRPRPPSALHGLRGSASIVGDDTAVVAAEKEETASSVGFDERIAAFDAEMDDCKSPIDSSTRAAAAVQGTGTVFDVHLDGPVPIQDLDLAILGDPLPYCVNLQADDPEGLIPRGEHDFRGRLDIESGCNLLATSTVERMQLMHTMKPVDENDQSQGMLTTRVPVRGRLTIPVHVQYEGNGGIGGVEYRCQPEWEVVDDQDIEGPFDALVGLPIISESEELRVVLTADMAFPTTSSVASVATINGHLEIDDDDDDDLYADTTAAVIDQSSGH